MATAYLIHGFLGVGKTTLARRLEQMLPAIRFSHDEWMTRLYGEDPPVEQFPDFYRRVSEQLEEVWPRCLELGVDVVLDFGCWTRWERDALRAKIAAVGAEARLYRVTCSEEELWRRIEKRNTDLQGSLYIARSTFEILNHSFEPLGSDEERIEIPRVAGRVGSAQPTRSTSGSRATTQGVAARRVAVQGTDLGRNLKLDPGRQGNDLGWCPARHRIFHFGGRGWTPYPKRYGAGLTCRRLFWLTTG